MCREELWCLAGLLGAHPAATKELGLIPAHSLPLLDGRAGWSDPAGAQRGRPWVVGSRIQLGVVWG